MCPELIIWNYTQLQHFTKSNEDSWYPALYKSQT